MKEHQHNISYHGLQRRERFLFPDAALREALLNAVVHKDYTSGIPIQISVSDGRFVFWNPGGLPEHWTLKELLGKHPSRPFNPLLANAFFRAGYIEAWGRGIEKIYRECPGARHRSAGLGNSNIEGNLVSAWLTTRGDAPEQIAVALPSPSPRR